MTFSDEVLSSYLDGEAGPTLSREIETAMEADPQLMARMERLSGNDAILREAVDEALGEVPPRLTTALETQPSAQILEFKPKPKTKSGAAQPARNVKHLAAASVAALAIGAVIGFAAMPSPKPLVAASRDGVLFAGDKLGAALASTPSGVQAPVGAEKLTVALSFRGRDGRLCRQFDLGSDGKASRGVACRQGKDWRIEGWITAHPAASGEYQTAGGPDDAAITAVVDKLGVAQPLDQAGEAAAIKGGWK